MKADCYWNLHRNEWSVRQRPSNRVVEHGATIPMNDVTFVVQQAGRERVLREKKKNVHAFARGAVSSPIYMLHNSEMYREAQEARYNPYQMDTFQLADGTPIYGAEAVVLTTNEEGKAKVLVFGALILEPSSQEQGEVQQTSDSHRPEEGDEARVSEA